MTALRWARHLRALGHAVAIGTAWTGQPCDALLALHARRSHPSIKAWSEAPGHGPLILALTGTDLYRDIRHDADARESLALADRMIVLQPKGLDELAPALRAKTRVVFQSVRVGPRLAPPRRYRLVTVIGHLRDEKDPFRAVSALALLPRTTRLRIVQLGQAMSAEFAEEARERMRADSRYRWLGELPHAHAMRWLRRSHAMVISSRMEGGAHVVSEAIRAGVPVIASDIAGNRGLLGDAYPGYYPLEDERALAGLLARIESEPIFLDALAAAVRARRHVVAPAAEREALAAVLAEVAGAAPLTRPRKSAAAGPTR